MVMRFVLEWLKILIGIAIAPLQLASLFLLVLAYWTAHGLYVIGCWTDHREAAEPFSALMKRYIDHPTGEHREQ